jgi:hypothetical protein
MHKNIFRVCRLHPAVHLLLWSRRLWKFHDSEDLDLGPLSSNCQQTHASTQLQGWVSRLLGLPNSPPYSGWKEAVGITGGSGYRTLIYLAVNRAGRRPQRPNTKPGTDLTLFYFSLRQWDIVLARITAITVVSFAACAVPCSLNSAGPHENLSLS